MNIFEYFKKFEQNQDAIRYLEQMSWKDGVICTKCGSKKTCKYHVGTRKGRQCWYCHHVFMMTKIFIIVAELLPIPQIYASSTVEETTVGVERLKNSICDTFKRSSSGNYRKYCCSFN